MGELEHTYRAPGKRELPLLEGLRIAAPCEVSWDAMEGNGRVRHCNQCDKQVFNVSAMSRADAEVLIRERVGDVCVRLYQREDGTILTSDCPVGVRRRLSARALMSFAATALLGVLSLIGLRGHGGAEPKQNQRTRAVGYATHEREESMMTASMLALANDARLAESEARLTEEAAVKRVTAGHPPRGPGGGRHTMGALCPIGPRRSF
jgi:hypothetical protein